LPIRSANEVDGARAMVRAALLSWGPVESMSNGYFVRTEGLLELLSKTYGRVLHVELSEEAVVPRTEKALNGRVLRLVLPDFRPKGATGYLHRILYYQRLGRRLAGILSRMSIVIVGGVMLLPLALSVLRRRKRPLVALDAHMCIFEREMRRGLPIHPLIRIAECTTINMVDAVIALSDEMANRCRRACLLGRRIIVLPFVLPARLRSRRTCKKGRPDNGHIVFVFIGSLKTSHNIEAVYNAIKCLARSRALRSTVRFVIAGAPGRLRRLVGREWGNIVFRGFIDQRELEELLCDSDVLLSTSYTMSGVSTKTLYYTRFCGKTIVVTPQSGEGLWRILRLYEQYCGHVVLARSPGELCEKLEELIHGSWGRA